MRLTKVNLKRKNFDETITDCMIRTAKKFYTQEEYLAFERKSLEKHEYYQGEIFDMAGTRVNHNRVQMNFTGEVRAFLKGKSCDVYGSDLRIHIPSNTLYTYPDALIVCGEPELVDEEFDTVLNPVVIVEVLSTSTQDYDRNEKFMLYRSIETLREYILIDSLSVTVEHHLKQIDDNWKLTKYSSLSDAFLITSINYTLPLNELYRDVKF